MTIPTSRTKWKESKESFPTPILTKAQFVAAYQRGLFGNRAPTWQTIDEFKEAGYNGLVHVRNRVAGGPTWYDIPSSEVEGFTRHLVERGSVTLANCYFSGMAPTAKTILQGELRQSERYLDLYYSRVPKPMRASLLEGGRQSYGIVALGLLKTYCDPSSYDWIQELLESYPGHVVEFSCYAMNWGTVPHRNTVIWEVRGY